MSKNLLVISDNHGSFRNVEHVIKHFKGKYDAVVHCGDSEVSPDTLSGMFECPVFMAKGNCDYGFDREPEMIFEFADHLCYVTHGHLQGVNWDDTELVQIALENSVDVVFYGHTHVPAYRVYHEEGVTVLNPGSIAKPRQYPPENSFLIVEFCDDGSIKPHFYVV